MGSPALRATGAAACRGGIYAARRFSTVAHRRVCPPKQLHFFFKVSVHNQNRPPTSGTEPAGDRNHHGGSVREPLDIKYAPARAPAQMDRMLCMNEKLAGCGLYAQKCALKLKCTPAKKQSQICPPDTTRRRNDRGASRRERPPTFGAANWMSTPHHRAEAKRQGNAVSQRGGSAVMTAAPTSCAPSAEMVDRASTRGNARNTKG